MLELMVLAGRALLHLVLTAALVGAGVLVGRALLARLRFRSRLERATMTAVLGVGTIGAVLSLLALVGWFQTWLVLAILIAMPVIAAAYLRRRREPPLPVAEPAFGGLSGRVLGTWAVGGGLLVLGLWTLAVYPPTAFDDTMYHLPYAVSLLEEGRLGFLGDLRFPVFPQLNEVLFATVMLSGSDLAPHYLQTLLFLLLGATAFVWARSRWDGSVAVLVTALILGTPLLVWVGTTAFVDLTAALFVTAALLARERWEDAEGAGWLLVAGALLGMAAGTKYHALYFVVAIGAVESVRGVARRQLAAVGGFWALSAMTGGVWYLRNVLLTGNPLFPFMSSVFGENEWARFFRLRPRWREWSLVEPAGAGWEAIVTQLMEVGRHLAVLPWRLLREAIWPTQMPPYSAFWVSLLPVALIVAMRRSRDRYLALLVLGFLVCWSASLRDPRYLAYTVAVTALLAAPLMSPVAHFLTERAAGWRTAAMALLPVVLLAPALAYSTVRAVSFGPPPAGVEAREIYLGERYQGYTILQCLNRELGTEYTVYGLFMEHLPYYAEGRLLGDWNGPFGYRRTVPLLTDPPVLAAEVSAMGAELLLVAERAAVHLHPEGTPAPEPFDLIVECGRARLYALKPGFELECECPELGRRAWRSSDGS